MGEILIRIQKHIFLITLTVACLLGVSLAYLGSVLTRYLMQSTQGEVVQKRKTRTARTSATRRFRPFSDFEPIITGSLIRDSGRSLAVGEPGQADASPITVVGLLAGSPSFAYASIKVEGKDDIQEYRIGETVAGHKIVRISSNSITVDRGGQTFEILIGEKSSEARTTQAAPTGNANAQKSSISRTKLKQLMKDEKTLRQARVAPFMLKGKMRGVRILSIPPNHVFYKLGARPGDIIRRFNGGRLNSTAKLIEIYQNLANLPRVTVDVERGGKIQSFEFVITD